MLIARFSLVQLQNTKLVNIFKWPHINFSDHVLNSLAEDIFKAIARTPGCADSLEARLVPTLVSILEAQGDKVTMGLQSVAMDILQVLVRSYGSSSSTQQQQQQSGSSIPARPLSQLLVANAFPAAIKCTLHTDDNSVSQVL